MFLAAPESERKTIFAKRASFDSSQAEEKLLPFNDFRVCRVCSFLQRRALELEMNASLGLGVGKSV